MKTASLRRRVTVAALLVLAVVLVGFDGWLYTSFDARLNADLSQQLRSRAQLAVSVGASLAPQQLADRLAGGGVTAEISQGSARYVGRPPASGPPAHPPAPVPAPSKAVPVARVKTSGSELTLTQPLAGGEHLRLTASRQSISDELRRLLILELVGTAAGLIVAALALTWLAAGALAPLDRTTAVARAIAAGDARQRLRPQRTDTELGRMAQAFDAMLDELDRALELARTAELRLREFLSDAAHELRTPVAALQAGAETLLRDDPARTQREQVTARMVRDATRAGRLVGDLLTLSRLDTDPALELSEFDLVSLARQELARTDVLAPQLDLRLDGPLRLAVTADRDRIAQVIANLLDNARHATPNGGTIVVELRTCDDRAVVNVSDTGAGIPHAERERVFERFARLDGDRVRVDGDRGRGYPGSGLGLPIARGIAAAHGASLSVVESVTGARLELSLPRHPEAASRAPK